MNEQISGGLFITFEGPDKAGKSTQIRILADRLREMNYDVLVTREPGGTEFCEQLRSLVTQYKGEDIAPEAELLVFGASRAQLVRRVILPHLEKGGVVLCDRFADSTTAYQGEARGLSRRFISEMHEFSIGNRWPDRTFLLDLTVEESRRRQQLMNGDREDDRFEEESRHFHFAVREGFLQLAAENPERIRKIDASMTVEEVAAAIWEEVEHAIH